MKLSIITCVYNAEKTISKCVESVLHQSYKDFEYIIVNDGSTDSTINIINSYRDPRIRVINNEVNQGLGMSRIIGVNVSNGEYIGFIDADDYIEIDFYKHLIESAIENDADVVQDTVNFIPIGFKTNIVDNINTGIFYTCEDKFKFIYKTYLCNKVIKKYILHKYMKPFRFLEDTSTTILSINSANKLVNLDYRGYNYILHKDSLCYSVSKLEHLLYHTLTDLYIIDEIPYAHTYLKFIDDKNIVRNNIINICKYNMSDFKQDVDKRDLITLYNLILQIYPDKLFQEKQYIYDIIGSL